MKNEHKILSLSILFITLVLASCNQFDTPQPTYFPNPAIKKDGFPVKNSIFIANIIDSRPSGEKVNFDPSGSPLLLIPFWPYDHTKTSPVLKYTFLQSEMSNTVKHLAAEDIRVAGIFSYVITQSYGVKGPKEAKYAAKIPNNAYILELEIKKAIWSRYMTTYGLSIAGSFLWFFAPESYGSVTVSIEAKLYSPLNRGKPIAITTITKETNCTEWAYDQVNYLPPVSEFKVAEIFPDLMSNLRAFLINALSSKK